MFECYINFNSLNNSNKFLSWNFSFSNQAQKYIYYVYMKEKKGHFFLAIKLKILLLPLQSYPVFHFSSFYTHHTFKLQNLTYQSHSNNKYVYVCLLCLSVHVICWPRNLIVSELLGTVLQISLTEWSTESLNG